MTKMRTARYHALVAGASGVVGRRLAEVLAGDPDWEVIGLSRRAPASAEVDIAIWGGHGDGGVRYLQKWGDTRR